MKMKIPNYKAKEYVQNRQPFTGSNTFGECVGDAYVVYSYGHHWPMFIYVGNKWYENKDSRSVSTSKHQTQLRPCNTNLINGSELRDMIKNL